MSKKFDVIIIGAGIGALTAGTHLSKNGYKVLILEKHCQAGGYCSSFNRSFFRFDCGAHLISSCNKSDVFGDLLKWLDIRVDFVQLNPTDRFFFYNDKGIFDIIEVSSDYHEFIRYLKNRFKSESSNIDRFFDEIHKTEKSFLVPILMEKYESYTYQDFLEFFFTNKELISILSVQSGFLGLPPNKVSALSAIFMLKMYIIDGAFYPRGGAQKLADAFVDSFRKNGGTLLLNHEVKKILTNKGCVKGVLVDFREIYESDYIVSNIDCRKTFRNLLDVDISSLDRNIKEKMNSFKVGESCFALYLGLDDKIDLDCKNGWYYSDYDVNRKFTDLLYVHIPTNYDQSVVTKMNYQVLILYVPLSINFMKVKNWTAKKRELKGVYLMRLEKLFPGLSESIVIIEAATPKTFERYTFNTNGSLYGWKQIPEQVYLNSFPSKSAIKGLFLCGHWTSPGGGVVTVALSGMQAARYIMKSSNR